MEKKIYDYKKGEVDNWLLDLERITSDGMEIVLDECYEITRFHFQDVTVSVQEREDELGVVIRAYSSKECLETITFLYAEINNDHKEKENITEIDDSEDLKQLLVNRVIDRMENDFEADDISAIDELLKFVPVKNLIDYLPEKEWEQFKKLIK